MCKEERDQQIADLYSSGRSAPALARDFSLSVPTIRAVIRAKGVKRAERSEEENAAVKARPTRRGLGRTHERLGESLASHRALELKQTRREASERLGWTPHKIASVEAGRFEVTLTDLLDLAEYTKKPLADLIKP